MCCSTNLNFKKILTGPTPGRLYFWRADAGTREKNPGRAGRRAERKVGGPGRAGGRPGRRLTKARVILLNWQLSPSYLTTKHLSYLILMSLSLSLFFNENIFIYIKIKKTKNCLVQHRCRALGL